MSIKTESIKDKLNRVLKDKENEISQIIKDAKDCSTLDARLRGPEGIFHQIATSEEERRALVDTHIYKKSQEKWLQLFNKQRGRITLTVPRVLYNALKVEALNHGVSLSELVRLKAAVPYDRITEVLSAPPQKRERELTTI